MIKILPFWGQPANAPMLEYFLLILVLDHPEIDSGWSNMKVAGWILALPPCQPGKHSQPLAPCQTQRV